LIAKLNEKKFMCGIAGIVNLNEEGKNQKGRVKTMIATIRHRGPDDEGFTTYKHAALGHCRLSIIDLSDSGHQPMHYKKYSIVYNGEIYNYIELKNELIELGHTFTTKTDTEVVLHSFDEWGKDCLHRFNGMWAFAILDRAKEELFCSRDRFGIKPFYFYKDNNSFIFASEIKAILATNVSSVAEIEILLDYLVLGYEQHKEKTFFKNINQLLPGQSLTIGLSQLSMFTDKYYSMLSHQYKTRHSSHEFSNNLKNAINIRMRSDVPVGTCLSGGLDSSTIAAIASKFYLEKTKSCFSAVTVKSESIHNDETKYAKRVVDHCNLDWHISFPTYHDFSKNIEKCLWFQEEPVLGPSVFMQYWVMKTAKDAGLKVMLDGQGGDEILLGYERYYIAYFCYLFKQKMFRRLIKEYFLAVKYSKLSFFRLSSYLIYFLNPPIRKIILSKRTSFLKPIFKKGVFNKLQLIKNSFLSLNKLQYLEIQSLQLPHLLKYEDRNSMAFSIEARVPFVDYNCIESAIALQPEEKINNGYTKFILRKIAEKLLPYDIAWRKNKIGFASPSEKWLNQHNAQMQELVSRSKILEYLCRYTPMLSELSNDISWKLYNIALWEEQYSVEVGIDRTDLAN
jgi:asparagine synthase (glutamine-hydrolysing)